MARQDGPEAEETAWSGPDGAEDDNGLTAGHPGPQRCPPGTEQHPRPAPARHRALANGPDTTQTSERATA
jgi:hypothetical protein